MTGHTLAARLRTRSFSARVPAWLACAVMPLSAAVAAGGCETIIGLHEPAALPADAGSGNAGTGGAAGAGGKANDKAGMCKAFCARANATCTGDYAIYHGAADCEPACKLLTAEQIQCRDQQVSAAMTSNEFWDHCQGATLGGSTACGGNCENYCAFMSVVCTDKNRVDGDLKMPDCVKKCKVLRDRESSLMGLPANTSRYNIDRDHEGDSLQCRLVHLSIASGPGAADAHCWHAALAPKPLDSAPNPCATEKSETEPRCQDYCQIVTNSCLDDDKVYENKAQCLATCAQLVPGDVSDYSGVDSVGCRKSHAYNALLIAPKPHCSHAGPGGAGLCGTDCPAYCRLFKAGCDAPFKDAFGSGADATSKCESACLTLRGQDAIDNYSVTTASAKGANPIACRLLYATRALEHPDQQATLCKSAAGTDATCKP